ncbi:MAG: ABC transporter ATP-binding protein [Pseudomonadota bacterium]
MNAEKAPTAQLDVEGLSVDLGGRRIVSDVSFALPQGEIGCLLGPSGCGKTTILNTIAGFEPPAAGEILLGGHKVACTSKQLPPEERRVGMVFQDLALFPHLTIQQNIAFGLKGQSRSSIKARTRELLGLVSMQEYANRYPHQISGGQQQRVALIRAMAPRPPILLLDEPFSSQDAELRMQLAQEVRELLKHDGITGILVTHDQHEAFAIADQIGVMSDGLLRQWDDAFSLYHKPADRFVADFVGEGVFVCGNTLGDNLVQTEFGVVKGELLKPFKAGELVDLLVRPDDVIHDDSSPNKATVVAKNFRGANHLYTLLMPGNTRLNCLAPSHYDHQIGEQIGVRLKVDHLVVFPN